MTHVENPSQAGQGARVQVIAERIVPILIENESEMIGAVLAHLVATWVSGHVVKDSAGLTDKLRDEVLELWLHVVFDLIQLEAKVVV